jgi:hypothetical protein
MDQLEGALRDGGAGGFSLTRDRHGRESEFDAVGVERLFDHRIGLAPDHELLARQGHHLRPYLDREIAELLDALHFQRFADQGREFGVLGELQPDLLDQLTGEVEVAV